MGTYFQNLEEFYKCKFYQWDLRISLSPFLINCSPGKGGEQPLESHINPGMLLASNFQNQFIFTLANISRYQNEGTSQTVLLRFSKAKKPCFQVPVVFSHPKSEWIYKLSLQEFWKVVILEISLQLSSCFIFFIQFHSPWNSGVPRFPQSQS